MVFIHSQNEVADVRPDFLKSNIPDWFFRKQHDLDCRTYRTSLTSVYLSQPPLDFVALYRIPYFAFDQYREFRFLRRDIVQRYVLSLYPCPVTKYKPYPRRTLDDFTAPELSGFWRATGH